MAALAAAAGLAACGNQPPSGVVSLARINRPAPGLTMVKHPRHSPGDLQAGVTVLVYGNDPAFADKTAAALERLASLGVNSVSLAFPLFQSNWTATDVHADSAQTPSLDNVARFARDAHRRGFTVMLRPLLDEQSLHPDGTWRGAIQPSDTGAWFRSYAAALQPFAALAQSQHVEVFDIGTEFVTLQDDTQAWLTLIAGLRKAYSGQLTYSANWDKPAPAFASALDFVGIDAFYPLNASPQAQVQDLVRAWQPWTAQMQQEAQSSGKPVVVTELGTTSEVASFQKPWLWQHNSGLSLESQNRYYAAACAALKPKVAGMYWWFFGLDPLAAPSTDTGYVPEGKPAEVQIGRCFG